jgi:cytochrome bd-type quinol oxidase subunit 1
MSYPLWDVPYLGGGLMIAIVAVIHVFISQFAVGGGIFLAIASRKAYRLGDANLLEYLKRHSRFFMLASLLFGGVTGVGIWFTVALVSPQATSILIRTFVWGWAIEWCCFLIETSAILLYYYGWGKLDAKTHQWLAWIYAGSSFLTLAVINAIVSFMLTPGRWLTTQTFWAGLFNPGYLPQLVMRTAASLALAGLYGLLTTSWQANPAVKERLVRFASKFVLTAFALFPVGALWSLWVIPESARGLALGGAAPVTIINGMTLILSVIIFGAAYFGPYLRPATFSVTFAVVLLALGLLATGGGEWVREGIRKPYIIYGYLYSNGVFADQAKPATGVLAVAKWSVYGSVDKAPSAVAAGEDVFRVQCAACHTRDGYNGIKPLVKGWTPDFAAGQIDRLQMLKGYMPPFMGSVGERDALAAYLTGLNQKEVSGYAKP